MRDRTPPPANPVPDGGSSARGKEKSSLLTPALALPTGGGAIRGIAEKFAANPVTGTGGMSVPIPTSPSRGGSGPALALSYDSGSGNGPFGFGWSLGMPSVTRRTDRGLPRYHDADDSDVFLLSGSDDLVPMLDDDGAKVADDTSVTGYTIERYRPRTEGAFARIERWTRQADGDVHWRTLSPDNVLSIFGATIGSRVADPADPRRIFTWLLCETRDDRGNAMVVEYKAEDATGVDVTSPEEAGRGDAASTARTANRYLKRVRYGNRVPLLDAQGRRPVHLSPAQRAATDWMFELVLDYGEHDADAPTPNDTGAWLCRNDPFSVYRSGFEVRTYRLCQRVLMFHHFPLEAGVGSDCLVRSVDLAYRESRGVADDRRRGNPIGSFLASVTQRGYIRAEGGGYESKGVPPLAFEYSEAVIAPEARALDAESMGNLPAGLAALKTQLVDLDGGGLPGILTTEQDAWYYKRNLGEGRFGPLERVATRPSLAELSRGTQALLDLGGDGSLDLVELDGEPAGFFERSMEEGWRRFVPFASRPNVEWRGDNVQLVDLTGDGRADLLLADEGIFTWHESMGEAGFGPARRVAQPLDEERGPHLVLTDGTQTVFLADMSGDGLTDLVRIRNGEVCYWPNIGYGRFGARVTMRNAPRFDTPERFDPRRIRLGDVDGSGVTDLVYVGDGEIRLWFNEAGNGWSAAHVLPDLPHVDDHTAVQLADLLGNGTACLVWSSPLPGDAGRALQYIDLMGGTKPHLMVRTINNCGAESRVQYAASTKFYLADHAAGRPWITRLPFPVHVVERVEHVDHVSRTRFASRFSYHHGCFDGEEREFRGFAMVEQHDVEAFEDYVAGVVHIEGTQELAPELWQPPVTTRTWYHTGAYLEGTRILHQLRDEYYRQEQHLPEPVLPDGMSDAEYREAVRALRGNVLRQEVYSFDGSVVAEHPYSVAETSYEVRRVQSRLGGRCAVFYSFARESVTYTYERNPADPRVAHGLALEVGPVGNVLKSATVVYGRSTVDATLPSEVTRDQQRLYVTCTETEYTDDIDRSSPVPAYRLRTAYESRGYELTGVRPTGNLFGAAELIGRIAAATPIAYEVVASGASAQRRPLSHARTVFRNDALAPLPLGQWDTLALGHRSYQLAFTPSVVAAHYGGQLTDADFTAAGYVHFDGDPNWWIPSGTAAYPASPAAHFYMPIGAVDPLGLETRVTFDQYDLLPERTRVVTAAWTEVSVVNDYRVLGPVMITDQNQNRRAVEVDALGMVVKTAVMGKAGAGEGDTLSDPTTRFEYDLTRWMTSGKPNVAHGFAREQHGGTAPRWQERYVYSNGAGGVAMVKVQANAGKAVRVGTDGTVEEVDADPRWIGNGRVVLNNKGNPVKAYEPFFSTTHEFEDEAALRHIGATALRYYDPPGRLVRTAFPDGTFSRIEFDSWCQRIFDANDTVLDSRWYAERGSPDPSVDPEPLSDQGRRAAWLAAQHAATPAVVHADSLGRTVLAVADHGGGMTAAVRSESDLTGRHTAVFDQLGRTVASGFVSQAGFPVYAESAERGRRWSFVNVLGGAVRSWDEYGRTFRVEYDGMHRPLSAIVREQGGADLVFHHVVYGERHPDAIARNLRGVAHQVFDTAGVLTLSAVDFKGNATSAERLLAGDYTTLPDWSALPGQSDYAAVQTAAAPLLETTEPLTASTAYDALNRPVESVLHGGTVIRRHFNEANVLSSLEARIQGSGPFREFLKAQDHDAKGLRRWAHHGNGVVTRFTHDPLTHRVMRIHSWRSGDDPAGQALQKLSYTYDPVGNLTHVVDDAQETHFFSNAVVKAESRFQYDAVYQLVKATGRELAGLGNDSTRDDGDLGFVAQLPHVNDAAAVRNYTERYEYNLLGNIRALRHTTSTTTGNWTRHYRYAYQDDPTNRTNRLAATSRPGDPEAGPFTATYDHDRYGNMTRLRLPTPGELSWSVLDQLQRVDLGGGGTAYYVYGASGQRVRKVIERAGSTRTERIYLGALEIYRERVGASAPHFERRTIHVSDDHGRIAQVDVKTRDDNGIDPANALDVPLVRYQYGNHLGSAVIETDDAGVVISYEEYHPFGTTAYRSSKPAADLSLKRYRFGGKERDDETGLYYFGARHYAPWLGRWTSCDPAGAVSGLNLFVYCSNNPVGRVDPSGLDDKYFSVTKPEDKYGADASFDTIVSAIPKGYHLRPGVTKDNYKDFWVPDHKLWNVVEPDAETTTGEGTGGAASASGAAAVKNNPKGFTLGVADNFDDAKIKAYKDRITDIGDQGVGIRSRPAGAASATKDLRDANKALRDAYNDSLPAGQQALKNVRDIDHTVELQNVIRGNGTPGADTVRAQDHRVQPSSVNKSQGASNQAAVRQQLANGAPVDTPAGGVARMRDMNKFWNRQGFRTVMRTGGYALGAAGLGVSLYYLPDEIASGQWFTASLSATGFAGGAWAMAGLAIKSPLLLRLGTATGAPAAVVGSGILGWQIGTYINENTGISDTAMAAGDWVQSQTGSTLLGATAAAGTAIVTAPYYAVAAAGTAITDFGGWLGETAYDLFN